MKNLLRKSVLLLVILANVIAFGLVVYMFSVEVDAILKFKLILTIVAVHIVSIMCSIIGFSSNPQDKIVEVEKEVSTKAKRQYKRKNSKSEVKYNSIELAYC